MRLPLLLLLRDSFGVLGRQSTTNGSGLFGSEIEWEVLFVLVENSQLVALVGVDNCEGSGNGFAEVVSV